MTERRAGEAFEAHLADRVRSWTDAAAERRIDPVAVSRAAMSSRRANGSSIDRLDAGWLGRRIARVRWPSALLAIVVIGMVAIVVAKPPPESAVQRPTPVTSSTPSLAASGDGSVPEVLRHAWQRPLPVAPGPSWKTAFLNLANGTLETRPALDAPASRSEIVVAGVDSFVVRATGETSGCSVGDVGTFDWSLEGKDTFLTLTAVGKDACTGREEALAGPWVRADLPPRLEGPPLAPGTYLTSTFDPFGNRAQSGRLSYTVPAGWTVQDDIVAATLLSPSVPAASGRPSGDLFVLLFARPTMVEFVDGAACGPPDEALGVGRRVEQLVAAVTARPGVVSTAPVAVTVGGYAGQMLDLHLATSWTGGCVLPDGKVGGLPILKVAGSEFGPLVGIVPDKPLRLILLDLGNEQTMAIAMFVPGPPGSEPFEDRVTAAMPIIESFKFPPATP